MDGGDRTKIQAVSITGCPFPDFETKIFRSRLVETAFEIIREFLPLTKMCERRGIYGWIQKLRKK